MTTAQTCAPIPATDPYCGFLNPLPSAFTATGATSATSTLNQYLPPLLGCPGLNVTLAPLLYCYGAAGPCNGATWKLPDNPADIKADALFFNSIKFADVSGKPLCLDACQALAKPIISCSILALIGVAPTSDPCAGLPSTNCVSLPGDASGKTLTWAATGGVPFVPGSSTAAPTTAAAAASSTTTKSADEKLFLVPVVAVLASFLVL
ncbi:UNVERIFIED_CONTAM: hypothetical protein HDU68_003233 [Siphonaria sp. JEL0065]|nr:hypothetical protein HDU68_003233 [Siphonaria sp. JEL0065]